MNKGRPSNIFDINKLFWIIFGIWPGKIPMKYFQCYSFLYITITTVIYNILLTINLYFTPRNIEAMINEFVFFFTEVAVISKVATVLMMREKIRATLKLMDCEEFQGHDAKGEEIVQTNCFTYIKYWRVYFTFSNFSYFSFIFLPLFLHLTRNADIDLPICKYYFLSDAIKEKYFWVWHLYQSVGIYAHMTYNINTDSFVAGLMLTCICQLDLLKHNFSMLQAKKSSVVESEDNMEKLKKNIQHYNLIVRYCSNVQHIISKVMFVQFCMASVIICVSTFGMLTVSPDTLSGMVSYLFMMTLQILVPGWLGTQIEFKSQELMEAVYNSDWVPQSESFKRNLCMFLLRANKPILFTGLKMFPLSMKTFISIIKMAYSFFTLLKKVQDREV